MTRLQKIIICINLLILAAYTAWLYTQKSNHLTILAQAFTIVAHLCAIIFAAIFAYFLRKKDIEKALWLSLGIILLIGFGTCIFIYN